MGEIEIAPLPQWIFKAIVGPSEVAPVPVPVARKDRYSAAALDGECDNVQAAAEGTRNHTLNAAAFSLGQLVGAGRLEREEVRQALLASTSLSEFEADRTIESGLDAGMKKPREDKMERLVQHVEEAEEETRDRRTNILVPGAHTTDDGDYTENSVNDFCRSVIASLPGGTVYNKGGACVEIVGMKGSRKVKSVSSARMRSIIDRHCRLIQWIRVGDDHFEKYRTCTKDMADIVLAAAADHPSVRQLTMVTSYPVFNKAWKLSPPGWCDGIYYDEPSCLENLRPKPDMEVFKDLIVDFPFDSDASMWNAVGMLFTPLLRPALDGNIPMHLVQSSLPRTGKTKLAEEVMGGVYYGKPTAAMQLSKSEDERDKRILSLLMRGDTIIHLDNLSDYLNSGTLASLITSSRYRGRILGGSIMVDVQNTLTMVATGNNTRASREIARRCVPIILQPHDDQPELRSNFKHPQLLRYAISSRRRVLESMIGFVKQWIERGRPAGTLRMGGFEAWAGAIGGILEDTLWMTNWRPWLRDGDPVSQELQVLVGAWYDNYKNAEVSSKELMHIVEENDLFGPQLKSAKSEHGKITLFGMMMNRYSNVPCGDFIILRDRTREGIKFHLEDQRQSANDGEE